MSVVTIANPTVVMINGVDISSAVRRIECRADIASISTVTIELIGCRWGTQQGDGWVIALETPGYVRPTPPAPLPTRAIRLTDGET